MRFRFYYTRKSGAQEVFAIETLCCPSVRAAVAHARHRFNHLLYPVHSCLIVWDKNGVHQHHTVNNIKEA